MSAPCIALLGQGTVGSGVLRLLQRQWTQLKKLSPHQIELRWICDRHLKNGHLTLEGIGRINTASNPQAALRDSAVTIVIEVLGGLDQAKNLVFKALETKRHVITANKLLISTHWPKLSLLSVQNNRRVLFEASVASGLPIIQAIKESLSPSQIHKIRGILNGTTNYILTRMEQDGLTFDQALKLAQQQGFAEQDPGLDLSGHDTAHKLSILASLATQQWIDPKLIARQGLLGIDLEDVNFAQEQLNSYIRLIGHFESISSAKIRSWVGPCLISRRHPLAAVSNENNAIELTTDAAGELYFQGKGAGSLPAASAIVSDLINLLRYWDHTHHRTSLPMASAVKYSAIDSEISSAFYLRAQTPDKPGALAQLTSLLARHKISIRQIHQELAPEQSGKSSASIMILTHQTKKSTIAAAIKESTRYNNFHIKTAIPKLTLNS